MTHLTSPGLNPCLKLKKWDFTGIMWIQHPVWTGRRSGSGTHYLQKHCATPAVNTAPRVTEITEVTRGDTVRCVDSTKQHGQRESNWKINLTLCFPVSWITASTQKHTLCLQPVSHSAYCRSTSPFLLATSSKVLLLLGCLVPFSHFPSLPPPLSSSPSSSASSSQVSVSTLVLVDDVPAAAQLFPHVSNFLTKGGILPLQEGRAHRDLVLLQPPGVPWALRRLVVLDSPAPVLFILSAAVLYVGVCGEESGGRRVQKESGMRRVSYVMRERKDGKEGNGGNSSIVKKTQHKKHTLYWTARVNVKPMFVFISMETSWLAIDIKFYKQATSK